MVVEFRFFPDTLVNVRDTLIICKFHAPATFSNSYFHVIMEGANNAHKVAGASCFFKNAPETFPVNCVKGLGEVYE